MSGESGLGSPASYHCSLRVALVAPFGLAPKGTTIARVLPIASVLAAQGASVAVFVPPWDDLPRAGKSWHQDGVSVVHARIGPSALGPALTLFDLARRVRDFRPDVIHAFKPIGYSGALAWSLEAKNRTSKRLLGRTKPPGAPLVVVDTDDLEGPAGWSSRKGLRLSGWLRGLQERHTLQTARCVTVASRWLREYVSALRAPDERVLYLPNGHGWGQPEPTPVAALSPGREDDFTTSSKLLWYTRFTEADPERATRLLGPLLQGEPNLRLTILGEEISPGGEAALRGALARAGLAPQTEWLGYGASGLEALTSTGQSRIVAVYPMDDDTVNRARCPSKVPQLMAMGLPIVAEAVGEIATYLAGLERECLVSPGDADSFRERVASLLRSPVSRATVSARLQSAARRWRWEQTAGGLLAWYQKEQEALTLVNS